MSELGFRLASRLEVVGDVRLLWAPTAVRDLERILDYVEARGDAQAAEAIYRRLWERIESLKHHPGQLRIVPELRELGILAYRELIVRPYRVVVRVEAEAVHILAVLDGRRALAALLLDRVAEP